MKTTYCVKCCKDITNNNFKKHIKSCNGVKIKKIRGIDFDPNSGYKNGIRKAWNKGLTKETDSRVFENSLGVKKYYENNEPNGYCSKKYHKDNTEQHRVNSAKGGGYRENAGRSQKTKVIDSFGKLTTLQSSYELRCSEILNNLNIKWLRPKALKYDNRNYFADFYLPEYDIWLDPKNSYKAKQDEEKIAKVIEQNNVKLFILLKEQLTEEYIRTIIQW
jgi:hypothetical protein